MSGDYCKLSRQIQDCFLWGDEPFTRGQAWVDLIMLANYSDGHLRVRGILVPVARGQVGRSELTLAEKWKWSRGKVRRFLEELVQQNMVKVVQQKNKLTTLITIVNYGKWQDSNTTDSTTKRTTDSTTDSTTNGHQTDTNKNKKKEKKEDMPDGFQEFWLVYPKKVGKITAVAEWKKQCINGNWPDVVSGAKRYVSSLDDVKYALEPERFIKRRRWEDEPVQQGLFNAKPKPASTGRVV